MAVTSELRASIRRESERVEEDATYSSKGHYEQAATWRRWANVLGLGSALVAALAGLSAFKNNPDLAGTLAVASAALTALLTFLKPGDKAAAHDKAGSLYNALKAQARFLRTVDLLSEQRDEALVKQLRTVAAERSALNLASPAIPARAFKRARKGIEAGEALYQTDQSPPLSSDT